jgi:hypothetical protein
VAGRAFAHPERARSSGVRRSKVRRFFFRADILVAYSAQGISCPDLRVGGARDAVGMNNRSES